MWFFYFARITQDARHRTHRPYGAPANSPRIPGFADIATFFGLCVWLAPLFLFLSLSANDNALPTNTGGHSAFCTVSYMTTNMASRTKSPLVSHFSCKTHHDPTPRVALQISL